MLTPAASAAGSLSRIAAQARPGLVATCDEREPEHERARRSRRSGSRRCRRWRSSGLRTLRARSRRHRPRAAGEPAPAVRELDLVQDDRDRAGGHQRDQRQVEPAEPQRGQSDRARRSRAVIRPASRSRTGRAGDVAKASRAPTQVPTPRSADLAERDHPDRPVEHPEPGGDDRRRSPTLVNVVDPVAAERWQEATTSAMNSSAVTPITVARVRRYRRRGEQRLRHRSPAPSWR